MDSEKIGFLGEKRMMEDFEKKVSITEKMESDIDEAACSSSSSSSSTTSSSKTVHLLRSFLAIQERRAQAYSKLKRYFLHNPLRLFSIISLCFVHT